MNVAAAQMKFRASVEENAGWIVRAIRSLSRQGVDAVLFPECAVTAYNRDFGKLAASAVASALDAIGAAAREAHCNVLVGSPTFRGGKRYNSLVVFDRAGREIFCYSK